MTSLVVTTIHPPTAALRSLAAGCLEHGWDFVVAGDRKSPADFRLDGCRFLSLDAQRDSPHALGRLCPERTYARKNLGYLAAMAAGARVIVETDDDNHPRPGFWAPRELRVRCRPVAHRGWVNAYGYFSRRFIYPRGLPLEVARDPAPAAGAPAELDCPIQQGLADSDPDVDAVYRMLFPLPLDFDVPHDPVLLQPGAWCPFNSQNTTFFGPALPLLYLPAHCSFRMTDIWRGFVAQRILHELGSGVLFHGPTVWQERNEHDLHADFLAELPGYTANARIREALAATGFPPGASVRQMVEQCYQALIRNQWVGAAEEPLLNAWFDDIDQLGPR